MICIQGCCQANLRREPPSMVVRQGNRPYTTSPIYMREPAAEDEMKGVVQNASTDDEPPRKAANEESVPSSEG